MPYCEGCVHKINWGPHYACHLLDIKRRCGEPPDRVANRFQVEIDLSLLRGSHFPSQYNPALIVSCPLKTEGAE